MNWIPGLLIMAAAALARPLSAAPVGAVLYRQGSPVHYPRYNVPITAPLNYFGNLYGPAFENNLCAYRITLDSAAHNCIDFIAKFKPGPVLQYFDNPSADEHNTNTWGTDVFSISTSMGLGPFRLLYGNQWLNPKLGKNIDSMVVAILDSSVQSPKLSIVYHGWNIGNGNKVTVTWTLGTTLNERAAHCEVNIAGNYPGKVVVGIVNNNKRGHPVTVIKDSTRVLLATLGKQGGLKEGFNDTLLLAAFSNKNYFSAFAEDSLNVGMVLTPDSNKSVKWSIAYSWAGESDPIFRNPNWQDLLIGKSVANNIREHFFLDKVKKLRNQKLTENYGTFLLSGQKFDFKPGVEKETRSGIFVVRGTYDLEKDLHLDFRN